MPDIRHQLIIRSAARKIYDAITSRDGLMAWWTPDAKARPELNSIARFGFGPAYFKEMKIMELRANERVVWKCISGADEWIGTAISFELHQGSKPDLLNTHPELTDQLQQGLTDYGTLLVFRQEDWKEYTPMYAECNYTWGRFLRSLKLLCETGKGTPWPDQHRV